MDAKTFLQVLFVSCQNIYWGHDLAENAASALFTTRDLPQFPLEVQVK